MLVGNVYYVTSNYNETKFKALLEKQLSQNATIPPSAELVEQAIAAYLACKDACISDKALRIFKMHLNSMQYFDNRNYCGNEVVGEPLEAVNAFNQLAILHKLS